MLKSAKRIALKICKNLGLFHLSRDSRWRQRRLLILCYHGISLEDEHQWNPALYMRPSDLEARFEMLKQGGYQVISLREGIERLYKNDLPQRSVAITFDDGDYDFYKQAYPLLKAYNYPATVYITTFYCDFNRPIFGLICSYMMWKQRGAILDFNRLTGANLQINLSTPNGREQALDVLVKFAVEQELSAQQKDQLAEGLAHQLGIDYEELRAKRILHLMNPEEVAELAGAQGSGIDFELHTHRHCSPLDLALFRREIQENRRRIEAMTGSQAVHFCYPRGIHKPKLLPWLSAEQVVSATTCQPGLASAESNALLLPRVVDHSGLAPIEFEGWLTGIASLMPRKPTHVG